MNYDLDIAVVVPLFNEDESLPELVNWINRVMNENNFSYEVLLINDGSTDNSWKVIEELSMKYPQVKGISFLRNYGKSAALNVGFQNVKANVVITMDADLQDSPDEIPSLYNKIVKEGYDLVSGWKQTRHDPISKTIPSKFFNYITGLASGVKLHDFNCGLKAYNVKVVKSIEVYGEMHRYIPVIAKWTGFRKIGEQVVEHRARKYGVTKFGLERFVNGFLDLMSISFVTRFKKSPMHFFGTLGSFCFLLGFIASVWVIGTKLWVSHILHQIPEREIVEKPLFYVALVALVIGTQLFLAGFLAEIIALNQPTRSDYHIEEKIGFDG